MDFEHSCDVLVAGGGVAGIAAALECARAGLHTVLVEKTILTGGLATSGLVNIYLPLCDGHGCQVTYGIAEELLQLSIRYGPGEIPPGWEAGSAEPRRGRYLTPFSPASFVLALDEVLGEAEVEVMLDTLVCKPMMVENRITGLEVENKSGRGRVHAACVIDASGDADVVHRSGYACAEGDNWLSIWALQNSRAAALQEVEDRAGDALLDMQHLGGDAWGTGQPAGMPKFSGTDHTQVTRFVLEGRRLLRENYLARQNHLGANGRRDLFPICLPSQAQFRTTRRIVGLATLADGQSNTYCEESVGLVGDWRVPGVVWEIPLGTLIPQRVDGVLAAGRCISSKGDAWEATRVIPAAALTGQAAGIAARLAVRANLLPRQVSAPMVQVELERLGIPFHF